MVPCSGDVHCVSQFVRMLIGSGLLSRDGGDVWEGPYSSWLAMWWRDDTFMVFSSNLV